METPTVWIVEARPVPTPTQPTALTSLEIEQAADEAIQMLCEKLAQAEAERDELLANAVALLERADQLFTVSYFLGMNLEDLRQAVISIGTGVSL